MHHISWQSCFLGSLQAREGREGGREGMIIMGKKVEMIKWRHDEGREDSARDGRG